VILTRRVWRIYLINGKGQLLYFNFINSIKFAYTKICIFKLFSVVYFTKFTKSSLEINTKKNAFIIRVLYNCGSNYNNVYGYFNLGHNIEFALKLN
jgi:hypothetical protein